MEELIGQGGCSIEYKLNFMRLPILFVLLCFLASCGEDDAVTPTTGPQGFQSEEELFPTVTPELRPFYIAFEEEAANRGFDINLTQEEVTGNIVQLGNMGVLGVCVRNDEAPNRVAVDQEAWASASQAFRELIVFHELGHCVLNREHLDNEDANGICVSIMNSGLSGCDISLEQEKVREEYLDELFFF